MKVDDDMIAWLLSVARWWLSEFGVEESRLVLPDAAHFPKSGVDDIFEACAGFAGMRSEDGWKFELVEESPEANPLSRVEHPAMPSVTLRPEEEKLEPGDRYEIPYSLEDADNPQALIASFATSLSHYLLQSARSDVPGGERTWDAVNDLSSVFLGFGIFKANSASQFSRFEDGLMQGWKSAQRGALGEDVLGYAVALFVLIRNADEKEAARHLESTPRAAFKWALKDLADRHKPELDKLREVKPLASQEGPYR